MRVRLTIGAALARRRVTLPKLRSISGGVSGGGGRGLCVRERPFGNPPPHAHTLLMWLYLGKSIAALLHVPFSVSFSAMRSFGAISSIAPFPAVRHHLVVAGRTPAA